MPGIFAEERGFIVKLSDRSVALYADQLDVVEEKSGAKEWPGKLKVFIVGKQGNRLLVLLRQEAGTGERTLLVDQDLVEYAR